MNQTRRLYPTVQEERELEYWEKKLGLDRTDIGRNARLSNEPPKE